MTCSPTMRVVPLWGRIIRPSRADWQREVWTWPTTLLGQKETLVIYRRSASRLALESRQVIQPSSEKEYGSSYHGSLKTNRVPLKEARHLLSLDGRLSGSNPREYDLRPLSRNSTQSPSLAKRRTAGKGKPCRSSKKTSKDNPSICRSTVRLESARKCAGRRPGWPHPQTSQDPKVRHFILEATRPNQRQERRLPRAVLPHQSVTGPAAPTAASARKFSMKMRSIPDSSSGPNRLPWRWSGWVCGDPLTPPPPM